jgi:hypothetical protein
MTSHRAHPPLMVHWSKTDNPIQTGPHPGSWPVRIRIPETPSPPASRYVLLELAVDPVLSHQLRVGCRPWPRAPRSARRSGRRTGRWRAGGDQDDLPLRGVAPDPPEDRVPHAGVQRGPWARRRSAAARRGRGRGPWRDAIWCVGRCVFRPVAGRPTASEGVTPAARPEAGATAALEGGAGRRAKGW